MDRFTGMAAGLWAKQKMGGMGMGGDNGGIDPKVVATSAQTRKELRASRAARDKDYKQKQADRASKKESVAARWAANKSRAGQQEEK